MRVEGKIGVVTGAASGLGLAASERLLRAGARIALFDRDAEAVAAVADRWGAAALPCVVDVADTDSVHDAITTVRQQWGEIAILVNAAGLASAEKITDGTKAGSLEDFRRVVEVNLIGLYDVMRLCATSMTANEPEAGERGVIVNVSSGAAWQGQKGQSAYSASKAGVLGLTLPAARDLATFGVRVVAVAPGLFDTAMVSGMPHAVREKLGSMVLNPSRMGRPEEFAMLVEQIVENPYLNATTLNLDGGVRMT